MSRSKSIDLSIIILSYNTKAITLACLDSLYRLTTSLEFEVIVVDNGSGDGSVEALVEFGAKHNNFQLIRGNTNIGFSAANNLGAKMALGKFILFLNSDTIFIEDNLSICFGVVNKNKEIGAYSCNLLNRDGSHQPSGGYFPNLFRLLVWQLFIDDLPPFSLLIKSIHPHVSKGQPDWITGAFMIVPKDLFFETGGFDQNIFMYTEELELCYRIRKTGKKIIHDSKTSIIHLGGASGGSHLALTAEVRGMLYFWQKHLPNWQIPLVKSIFFVGSLLRYFIFGIIGHNASARQSYREILRLTA